MYSICVRISCIVCEAPTMVMAGCMNDDRKPWNMSTAPSVNDPPMTRYTPRMSTMLLARVVSKPGSAPRYWLSRATRTSCAFSEAW